MRCAPQVVPVARRQRQIAYPSPAVEVAPWRPPSAAGGGRWLADVAGRVMVAAVAALADWLRFFGSASTFLS